MRPFAPRLRSRQSWRSRSRTVSTRSTANKASTTGQVWKPWPPRILQEGNAPLKKKFPLYELSPLILDLDAENSKNVRPYDIDDSRQQHYKWRYNSATEATKERIVAFRQVLADEDKILEKLASPGFRPWDISDRDILALAILGNPGVVDHTGKSGVTASQHSGEDRGGGRQHAALQQVLRQNAINEPIFKQGESKTIHYMLHRQGLARQPDYSNLGDDIAQGFKTALATCDNLTELRRLVTAVAQTAQGAKLVSQCGSDISKACRTLVEVARSANALEVLVFLNNLTSNLERKTSNPDDALCFAGLYYSCYCLQPAAIRRYLNLIGEGGLVAQGRGVIQDALFAMLESFSTETGHSVQKFAGSKEVRAELLNILTGQRLISNAQPQLSLRATLGTTKESLKAWGLYIALLGELGASRMVWHEWRSLYAAGSSSNSLAAGLRDGDLEEIISSALIRCARQLQTQPSLLSHPDFEIATGDVAKDALLDLQHIGRFDPNASNEEPTRLEDVVAGLSRQYSAWSVQDGSMQAIEAELQRRILKRVLTDA